MASFSPRNFQEENDATNSLTPLRGFVKERSSWSKKVNFNFMDGMTKGGLSMQILNCNELASNWLRLETFIFFPKSEMGSGIFQRGTTLAINAEPLWSTRVCGYQVENQYLASHGKCNVNFVSAKIPLFSFLTASSVAIAVLQVAVMLVVVVVIRT